MTEDKVQEISRSELRETFNPFFFDILKSYPFLPSFFTADFIADGLIKDSDISEEQYILECQNRKIIPHSSIEWKFDDFKRIFVPRGNSVLAAFDETYSLILGGRFNVHNLWLSDITRNEINTLKEDFIKNLEENNYFIDSFQIDYTSEGVESRLRLGTKIKIEFDFHGKEIIWTHVDDFKKYFYGLAGKYNYALPEFEEDGRNELKMEIYLTDILKRSEILSRQGLLLEH